MLLIHPICWLIVMHTRKLSSGPSTEAFTVVHPLSVQVCPHQPCKRMVNLTTLPHVRLPDS